MASRRSQAWQGIVAGAVMIVAGLALTVADVSIASVPAFPIIGAGTGILVSGLYKLFTAERDHRSTK
jgi:hypothetical protein